MKVRISEVLAVFSSLVATEVRTVLLYPFPSHLLNKQGNPILSWFQAIRSHPKLQSLVEQLEYVPLLLKIKVEPSPIRWCDRREIRQERLPLERVVNFPSEPFDAHKQLEYVRSRLMQAFKFVVMSWGTMPIDEQASGGRFPAGIATEPSSIMGALFRCMWRIHNKPPSIALRHDDSYFQVFRYYCPLSFILYPSEAPDGVLCYLMI